MHRFLHVTIGYSALTFDPKKLEPMVTLLASDWLRYHGNTWFLWTDKSQVTVCEMLNPQISSADTLMVFAVDPTVLPVGHMPPFVWQWINRPRDPITGLVHVDQQPTPANNPFLEASRQLALPGR